MRKIILASQSKARKELLRVLIGNNFIVEKSSYEEDNSLSMPPAKLTMFLSLNKARDVAQKHKRGIIIAADTLVFLGKKALGKPKDRKEAIRTLLLLSGKTHTVVTSVTVIDIDRNKELQDYETTRVKFKKLSRAEAKKYVLAYNPLDMSGAYGFTDRSCAFIEKVYGDYYSVVGLPLFKLNRLFCKLGIDIYKYR